MATQLLSVIIKNRQGTQYEGQVRALTSWNATGQFDVLPGHINFISIIRKKLVLHKTDGSKQQLGVDNGVMRILNNKIEIYLGVK